MKRILELLEDLEATCLRIIALLEESSALIKEMKDPTCKLSAD